MLDVVAALIRDGERLLICRRPEGKMCALNWEFPGGKVEIGETEAEAVRRECLEELGVELAVGRKLGEVVHVYPYRTVHLSLYECRIVRGTPQCLEHSSMRWITPAQLPDFEFCPADARLLAQLRGKSDDFTEVAF